jgi:hypothetical protein
LLFDLASKSDVVAFKGHRGFYEYFNMNRRNHIYSKTGYSLTSILEKKMEYLKPKIKMAVISRKTFQTRKNSAQRT